MKGTVSFNMGRTVIELEVGGETLQAVMKNVSLIQEIASRDTCDACSKKNIRLSVRTAKPKEGKPGGTYYELRCGDCGATLQIHEKKAENGGGMYIKWDEKFAKFTGKDADGNSFNQDTASNPF